MKRLLAILLALVLVLSLCACKAAKNDPNPEESQTDNIENSENNNSENANTEGSGDVTDESTGDTADNNAGDTADNNAGDTACSHDWKAATCTAAKTCSKCGATEGSAAGHNWKDATCSAPKTCATCGATEGSKGSHTFTADCTVCGQPNADYVTLGQSTWSYTQKKDGQLLMADYTFFDSVAEQGVNVGFTILTSFEEFAKKYEMTVDQVRAEYAGGEMHKTIDGVDYVYDGWGVDNWSDRRYKEENGVVTVEFLSLDWDDNDNEVWTVKETVVMKRTGMAEMTVTASNYTSTPVGTVLTGEYFGS